MQVPPIDAHLRIEDDTMSDDIFSSLYSAFPQTPVPERLFQNSDLSAGCHEFVIDLESRFQGKQWSAVRLDDWINTASPAVLRNVMTPEAYHYYVPSLMAGTLDDTNYIDCAQEALLPCNKHRIPKGKWWFDYFSLFSKEQRTTIILYAKHLEKILAKDSAEFFSCHDLISIWSES